jgi:hypothetical protein
MGRFNLVLYFVLGVTLWFGGLVAGNAEYATYLNLLGELAEIEASSQAIREYNREYTSSIPAATFWGPSQEESELETHIVGKQIIFLADYHSERVFKEQLLQLLPQFARQNHQPVLVLEWIDSRLDDSVQAFLNGSISIRQLRRVLRQENNWPFSLRDYLPILVEAKKLKIQVILAEDFSSGLRLKERDKEIAKKIRDHRVGHPDATYLVFYGAAHLLGRGHLQDEIQKQSGFERMLVLTGYADEVYWGRYVDINMEERLVPLGRDIFYWHALDPLVRLESAVASARSLNTWSTVDWEGEEL